MSPPLLPAGHGASLRAPFLLALAAVAVHFLPGAVAALEYDRQRIAAGELWRLLSCHWTHCSLDHLLLDALVLIMAGTVYQLRGGRRLLACVGATALAVPAVLWVAMPELARYRGLSGIDAAVTILLAVTMLRDGMHSQRLGDLLSAALAVAGLAAKIGFEVVAGQAAFVDSVADGFVPVPLAHLIGALTGLTVALIPVRKDIRRQQSIHYPTSCHENSCKYDILLGGEQIS